MATLAIPPPLNPPVTDGHQGAVHKLYNARGVGGVGYSFVILVLQQFCCTAKRIADLKEGVWRGGGRATVI